MRSKWTQQEINFLKENYGKISAQEIITKLDRSEFSVYNKAYKIGLNSSLHHQRKGKSYEEIFGKEQSEKIKQIKRIFLKKKWKDTFYREKMVNMSKGLWQNERYKQKTRKLLLLSLNKSPNKPEKAMMQIIKENNFPFKWVGDGKATIEGFSPDFIYLNQIIEVFGDYWHRREEVVERDNRKLRAYTSLGYKTLVVWENELKEPQKVAEKIFSFVKANESICQLKGGIVIK